MALRKLLITADDFGVCDPIDRGIERCIDRIHCVDMLVTHQSSKERISTFVKKYQDRIQKGHLKIGLHLTLTCGAPLNTTDRVYYRKMTQNPILGKPRFKRDSAATFIAYLNNIINDQNCINGLENEIVAQYEAFKSYTGMEPYHISSHEGVYSGHPRTYRMLREFCSSRDIAMRCPTFINFTKTEGYDYWIENDQKMLPPWKLDALKVFDEGRVISRWMQSGLEPEFNNDIAEGKFRSTDHFVEHFFQQGSSPHLKELLNQIAKTPTESERTFEMVVHPVSYKNQREIKRIPRGIKKSIMDLRVREAQALNHIDVNKRMKRLGIGKVD